MRSLERHGAPNMEARVSVHPTFVRGFPSRDGCLTGTYSHHGHNGSVGDGGR